MTHFVIHKYLATLRDKKSAARSIAMLAASLTGAHRVPAGKVSRDEVLFVHVVSLATDGALRRLRYGVHALYKRAGHVYFFWSFGSLFSSKSSAFVLYFMFKHGNEELT